MTLERVQAEREEQLREKHNEEMLKKMDRKETVDRILRVQEYEKEKLLSKIEEKMNRADNIKK